MVVLVAFTPLVGWSPWWALPVLPMNQALSQRSTPLAIGQGSYAVLLGCLIPKTSVGRIVWEEE